MKRKKFRWPDTMKPPMKWLVELANGLGGEEFFKFKEAIKQEWLDSQTNGTKFHDEREEELYKNGFALNPWDNFEYPVKQFDKEHDNQSLVEDLYTLEDGCYPELLVWLPVGNICIMGQIDVPYLGTESGNRFADVDDYKTNKKMSRSSSEKYFEPFTHLDTSKITNYSLQMSGYMYILENWGYKPRNLALTHYTNYDPTTGKRYELKYYRDEIKQMFEIFAKIHG